jgi:hypothetical protein
MKGQATRHTGVSRMVRSVGVVAIVLIVLGCIGETVAAKGGKVRTGKAGKEGKGGQNRAGTADLRQVRISSPTNCPYHPHARIHPRILACAYPHESTLACTHAVCVWAEATRQLGPRPCERVDLDISTVLQEIFL